MPFTFQIKNLNQVLSAIDTYSKDVQQNIDDEMTATAYRIVGDAQALAPVDDGNLRASIAVVRNEPFEKQIESGASYSAFQEFGTGTNVDIPAQPEGLGPYAEQFRGRGIRQVNILAHPYFFPSVWKNSLEMVQHMKLILEKQVV